MGNLRCVTEEQRINNSNIRNGMEKVDMQLHMSHFESKVQHLIIPSGVQYIVQRYNVQSTGCRSRKKLSGPRVQYSFCTSWLLGCLWLGKKWTSLRTLYKRQCEGLFHAIFFAGIWFHLVILRSKAPVLHKF